MAVAINTSWLSGTGLILEASRSPCGRAATRAPPNRGVLHVHVVSLVIGIETVIIMTIITVVFARSGCVNVGQGRNAVQFGGVENAFCGFLATRII